jgi:hypothetical protein
LGQGVIYGLRLQRGAASAPCPLLTAVAQLSRPKSAVCRAESYLSQPESASMREHTAGAKATKRNHVADAKLQPLPHSAPESGKKLIAEHILVPLAQIALPPPYLTERQLAAILGQVWSSCIC